MNIGSFINDMLQRLESFQSGRRWLAFPYAVLRKFGEDQTGNYAALIAYYGFMSLFPLLLVLVSLLGVFLQGNGRMQSQILTYATSEFPAIGSQLQKGVQGHSLHGSGLGLAIGIILTLIGARGVAGVISDALNHLWRVPFSDRPGFPFSWIRQLGMIFVMGLSIIGTTALVALGSWGIIPALIVNILAFLIVFRLGIARTISTGKLIDSAIIAAVFWQVLQYFGTSLVKHELHSTPGIFGTLALVLGLLWWIFIQSEVTLLAVEIHVVRELKLWPRSMTEPPLLEGDKKAYTRYAVSEKRRPEQKVSVDFKED